MPKRSARTIAALIIFVACLPACTTMQTTYFRAGYHQIVKAESPQLQAHQGAPSFSQVEDMAKTSHALYGEGYAMLGYTHFVSPLLTSLAQDYSIKWGTEVGATRVVLETPRAGASNLHYFLVTYWARVKPQQFSFGGYLSNLPDELLNRIGKEMNMVILEQVVPGTPAAAAGFRAGDVIVAVAGKHVPDTAAFMARVDDNAGKEVRMSILRQGTALEIPVHLAAAVSLPVPEGMGTVGYLESPWESTQPADFSGLSAAAIASATTAIVQDMQRQQREQEYERARARARANLEYLDSQSADAAGRGGRRGRGNGVPTSRRGGGAPQAGLAGGSVPYVDQKRAMQQMQDFGRSWGAQMDRQNQQNVGIWLDNAPNAYASWGHW